MRFSPGFHVIDALVPVWMAAEFAVFAAFAGDEPTAVDAVADQRPPDAPALLAAFAKMEGMEARFEEEKHLALLAAPLKSEGRLYFMAPGHLSRVVEKPRRSEVRISPTELLVKGEDGVERIDLRQSDDVRAFVTSLVSVFRGDEEALESAYDVGYVADPTNDRAWTLTLTPRRDPLTKLMKLLRIKGTGLHVKTIEVIEPSGDRTVTRIVEVDVKRRFTAVEKEQRFGIVPD